MSSIRPPGGWDPTPLAIQAEQAQLRQNAAPLYAYNLPVQRPWMTELRDMGGREIGGLTFGATFGATSGFLLARFVFGLLKVAILILAVIGFIGALRWFGHEQEPAPTSYVRRPVVRQSTVPADWRHDISPANPYQFEGTYPGLSPDEVEAAHEDFLRRQLQWEIDHAQN
jgi:hypothetical protein